jgi:hypothetical protein
VRLLCHASLQFAPFFKRHFTTHNLAINAKKDKMLEKKVKQQMQEMIVNSKHKKKQLKQSAVLPT